MRLIKVKLSFPAGDYLLANQYVDDASGQWERKLTAITPIQQSVGLDRSYERGGFTLTIDDTLETFKAMMSDETNRKIRGKTVTVYVYEPGGYVLADTIVATVFDWDKKENEFILNCVQEFVGLLGTVPMASTWRYTSVDSGETWGGGHTVWLNKWTHTGGAGTLTIVDAVGAGGGPAVVENDNSYLLEGYITIGSGTGVSIYVGDTLAGKVTATGAFSYQLVRVTAITDTTVRFVPDDGCAVDLESAMPWIPIGGVAKYWKMYKLIDPDGAFSDENYVGGGGGSGMFSAYLAGWTHDSAVAASSNPVTALSAVLATSGLTLVDDDSFAAWCTANSWLHNGITVENITALKEYIETWAYSFDAWWKISSDGKVHIRHIDWSSVTADATLTENHFIAFAEKADSSEFINRINASFNYDPMESKWADELTVDSVDGDYLPATSPVERDDEFLMFAYTVGASHPVTGMIKFLDHPVYTAEATMSLYQFEQLGLSLLKIATVTHYNQIGTTGKYLIVEVAPDYDSEEVYIRMIRLWGV
jgi:hypothetical protein